MEFHRLSDAFYMQFGHCEEILTKKERPYYVLLLELDGITYAIPLRSHINHPYCFIANSSAGQNSGLDYSKVVVINEYQKKFIVFYVSFYFNLSFYRSFYAPVNFFLFML